MALAGCGGGGGSAPAPVEAPVSGTGGVTGSIYSQYSGRASGAIAGVKTPLPEATVSCAGITAATDSEGKFFLEKVPAGRQLCSVSKQGWLMSQFTVVVEAGKTVEATTDGLLAEKTGVLEIASTPDGGDIFLDGFKLTIRTNSELYNIAAATHTVSVQSYGFERATVTVEVIEAATASVSVELVRLTTSIVFDWEGGALLSGEEKQINATCEYADGTNSDCTGKLAWASSNPAAAGVSPEGKVSALSPGTTIITASRPQSGIAFPGISVTIACPEGNSWQGGVCTSDTLQSISILPQSLAVQVGNLSALSASCTWSFAGNAPCPPLTWMSDNQALAAVNDSGIVTGIAEGTAAISASSGGITSGPVAVAVTPDSFPEPDCAGEPGFCLDIVGTRGAAGASLFLSVVAHNPPPPGLRGGAMSLTWDPSELSYVSFAPGTGVQVQAENPAQPGAFQLAFTSDTPISAEQILFTLTLTAGNIQNGAAAVNWDTSADKTNFTDFDFNLLSQNGIVFKNAFAKINGPM